MAKRKRTSRPHHEQHHDAEPAGTEAHASPHSGEEADNGGMALSDYSPMGRMVYQIAYGLSFGVVYPVSLVARIIPKENAIVYGLVDGARAARDTVYRSQSALPESEESGEQPALAAQPA